MCYCHGDININRPLKSVLFICRKSYCHYFENLIMSFDSTMDYESHISEICKSVRRYLNVESTEKLVHALVTSRLDNCNAVLFGLPDYLIKRLQYVLMRPRD